MLKDLHCARQPVELHTRQLEKSAGCHTGSMSLSTANRSESCLHAWANRGLFEAPIESRCDALCLLLGRRTTQLQSVCRILYVHVCPTDALC